MLVMLTPDCRGCDISGPTTVTFIRTDYCAMKQPNIANIPTANVTEFTSMRNLNRVLLYSRSSTSYFRSLTDSTVKPYPLPARFSFGTDRWISSKGL
jgi:hypothetical protein